MLEGKLIGGTLYIIAYSIGKSATVKITDSPLVALLSASMLDTAGDVTWTRLGPMSDAYERVLHCSTWELVPDEAEPAETIKMSYRVHSGNVGAPDPIIESPFTAPSRKGKKDE